MPARPACAGTPSGYYYHAAKNGSASKNKWVLTLQGGGECVSSKCNAKVKTALGSSSYFPKSYTFWNEGKTHLAGNVRLSTVCVRACVCASVSYYCTCACAQACA